MNAMKLGDLVKVDGEFAARVVALGPPGATVKFTREARARVTDAADADYLRRFAGLVFFPTAELDRLCPGGGAVAA